MSVPSPKKKGSLTELARLTGLSKASVCAALSGKGGHTRISPETARRVREAAEQINYRSNAGAKAIRSKRFNSIGFILVNKEACDYAFSDVMAEGITSGAAEYDQNVFLVRVPTFTDLSQSLPKALNEACLDGLIVQDSAQLTPQFTQAVESLDVPVIYLNDKRPTNAVYVDDLATGRVMTEFLLGRGYRRIALLAPTTRIPHYSTADRIEGYRCAMEEAGLPAMVKRYPSASWEEEAVEWLQSDKRPEVIFCHSDQVALVLQRVLYPLGLRIPQDIAIAGCNDEILAAHSPVPLTSMRIPFHAMARLAVDMLMKRIAHNGEDIPSAVLQPSLTERLSTAVSFNPHA
jgi:LacI family transcriptional regulator